MALLLCAVVSLIACDEPTPERAQPSPRFRNLILVMVDTLRSDHLPSYGYPRETAPFLAELAAAGVQLQGMSVSSWTKPSIATLLSGLYPQRHQAYTRSDKLPPGLPFLPEILKSHGFSTVGYTSNRFAGKDFDFSRGYDSWVGGLSPIGDLEATSFRNPLSPNKAHAAWVTEVGLELTRQIRQPFYLYIHYLDPHDPYTPRQPWGRYDAAAEGYLQPEEVTPASDGFAGQAQQLIDQYDAAIREADREIQRLLGSLALQGLLEETLVVVTADHGEEFGERGYLTHGKTLYEESLRVPFILWSPGDTLPRYRSEQRFHQVDFLPTILTALGIDPPTGLDGSSFWREILDASYLERQEQLYFLDLDVHASLALVAPPFKLIYRLPPAGESQAEDLLYRLDDDPAEQRLLTDLDDRRGELLRRLIERHNELSAASYGRKSTELSDAAREELAALGYLRVATPQQELDERRIPPRLRFREPAPP